jgi:hypothetical protein
MVSVVGVSEVVGGAGPPVKETAHGEPLVPNPLRFCHYCASIAILV